MHESPTVDHQQYGERSLESQQRRLERTWQHGRSEVIQYQTRQVCSSFHSHGHHRDRTRQQIQPAGSVCTKHGYCRENSIFLLSGVLEEWAAVPTPLGSKTRPLRLVAVRSTGSLATRHLHNLQTQSSDIAPRCKHLIRPLLSTSRVQDCTK